jgi:hypothetical protein
MANIINTQLQTLKTNAQSFTGINDDPLLRMLAYGLLKKAGSTVVDVNWLQTVAAGFQGWTPDFMLNTSVYSLAVQQGLQTNGAALQAVVDSITGWGKPNGIVDAQVVQGLIQYATLVIYGAPLTVQSTP